MKIVSYESANRYRGSMPVHFLRLDESELERVVESTPKGLRINLEAYNKIASQTSPPSQAQVHYLLLSGDLYRIFVGRTPTDRLQYGVAKSVVKIGSVSEESFDQLIPSVPNLTESQVNRAVRSVLRKNKNN